MQQLKFEQLVNKAPQTEEICKCMICLEVFIDPICCENCENHYCSSCITTWSQNQPARSCPACNKLKEKPAQRILKNMLHDLLVYCINKHNGCELILKYAEYFPHCKVCVYQMAHCEQPGCEVETLLKDRAAHEEVCEFKVLLCRWCKLNFTRKQLHVHQEQTCEQRCQFCELCQENINYRLLDHHKVNCPEIHVQCFWCLQELKKKDVELHSSQECPNIPIKCPGCTQVFQRLELKEHYEVCPMVELECPNCLMQVKRQVYADHTVDKCFKSLRNTIADQQLQIDVLNNAFRDLYQQLGKLQKKKEVHKFSQQNRHYETELRNHRTMALVSYQNQSIKDRLVFIENTEINKPIVIQFHIITDKFIAIGLADPITLTNKKDYYKLNHLSYLFSSNGVVFVSHSQQDNSKKKNFGFTMGQQVQLLYTHEMVRVTNLHTQLSLTIEFPTAQYVPVICLRGPGDQVEIIN